MLHSIEKKAFNNQNKKLSSRKKIMNKTQELVDSDPEPLDYKANYQKRVIFVSWKHRQNIKEEYVSYGSQVAPKKKIELNGRKDYSIEDIKKEFKNQYMCEKNQHYFKNVFVNLANSKGTIITKFVDRDGEPCDFWTYCKVNRGPNNHPLQMFLLTTTNAIESNSENKSPNRIVKSSTETAFFHDNKNASMTKKQEIDPIDLTGSNNTFLQDLKSSSMYNNQEKNQIDFVSPRYAAASDKNSKLSCQKSLMPSKNESLTNLLHRCPAFEPASASINSITKHSRVKTVDSSVSFTNVSSTSNRHDPSNDKSKFQANKSSQFVVPEPPLKKSKAEIVKKIKLSVENVESETVKISDKILGKGGQGEVRLGLYMGCKVAVKIMSSTTSDLSFVREVKLLSELHHDNIIGIRGVGENNNESYIVMEYFQSVNLYDVIFERKPREFELDINAKDKIAYQISCALKYLHSRPQAVIHQDLKPGNVLVSKNLVVKLCDFGLGKTEWTQKFLESSTCNNPRGTHFYMPPETLLHVKKATCSSDIWSLAATFVELYKEKTVWALEGFPNSSVCAQMNLNSKKIPDIENVSEQLKPILLQCFDYDPLKRPKIDDVFQAFSKLSSCTQLAHLTCD